MDFLLNLFYVYVFGCVFLTACFTVEWAIDKWNAREEWHDCTDEHAEKPNPL